MNVTSIGAVRRRQEQDAPSALDNRQVPLGRFRVKSTKDAHASARDGMLVYAMNDVYATDSSTVVELMFDDGEWLLAEREELES